MSETTWPAGERCGVISHKELLLRAREDLHRELNALTLQAAEEGLPGSCYSEERQALAAKISAVNTMLYCECGEFC